MQTIYATIIPVFLTSFIIITGALQVQGLSQEDHVNSVGALDGNGFNQLKGSTEDPIPQQESPDINSGNNQKYLSPDITPLNTNPTFKVTASRIDAPQYVYPEETPKIQFVTTEASLIEAEDSQIVQPDFSPEEIEENQPEIELQTDQYNNEESQPTQLPVEQITPQDPHDDVATNYGNVPEVLNDLDVETDVATDDETDGENETQLDEPLPTPVALISSNGEGSNPPLEEEFAEAFKRVGPNGRRRRISSGGHRRVRMRVRKRNRDNSTPTSTEIDVTYPTHDNNVEEPTITLETTTVRPRRYRSTTQSPDLDPHTISLSASGSSSVVKNGPKPLIITDIHSGSTGINPVTPEPQLEKPMVRGHTEKISTYFITPSSRISTTEAPKLPGNMSSDDLEWNRIGDSKPVESIVTSNSSPYENQKEAWEKNLMNFQRSSLHSSPTDGSGRSNQITPLKSSPVTNLQNGNIGNSLQQPPMEDRTYNVHDQGNNNYPHGFEAGNTFDPAAATIGTGQSNSFDQGYPTDGNLEDPSGSNNPRQETFSPHPFAGYEENVPFVTHGRPPPGSHYDRNKDPLLNGNQQYFKETSPFLSNGQENNLKSQPEFDHTGPQNHHHHNQPHQQFENAEFSSTASPQNGELFFNHQNQNNIHEYPNEMPVNQLENPTHVQVIDYDKIIQYSNDGFKSSPEDPTLNGVLTRNPKSFPRFRPAPSFNGNDHTSPSGPNELSQDSYPQNVHNYPHNVEEFNNGNQNSFPSGFPQFTGGGGPSDQVQYTQGAQNPSIIVPGNSPMNPQIIPSDQSNFIQTGSQGDAHALPQYSGPVYGTVETMPAYEHNGNQNHIQSQSDQNKFSNHPVFIASSPGEPNRNPTFSPPRPQGGPPPSYYRGPTFFRNNFRPPGPPMHHPPPRYFSRHPNGQGRPHPEFQNNSPYNNSPMPADHMRPPQDFRNNVPPHVSSSMSGLQNIPPPPLQQQALSEISPIHNFPPHAHSMSMKPDYEPANPPLPHDHPLENHFPAFVGNNNEGVTIINDHHEQTNGINFQNSNIGGQPDSSSANSQLTVPLSTINELPSTTDGPDFDILSAYYDKPPPTVGYDYNNQYRMKETPVEVNDNNLANVPYQYSNIDGGGLDGNHYFPNFESNKGVIEKPYVENNPSPYESELHGHEEKNKTAIYSDTPYVLMFPQLVPQEAMVPSPPKLLTKEIPVVSASSMSAMSFTPEGKPVLGPGLKTVPVHPRHQMYQVLAKAHYDNTMQKYLESKKKPPSAIYTPYGVLVPMGPTGSASSNHETYTAMQSKFNLRHHRKDPHHKHLLNLLLGKKTPLGNFYLHKGASIEKGHLKNHIDFKANFDPALDLLAEKLAIKLGAVKYVLSAPAKLGIHAFSEHSAYSQLNPVTVPNPLSSKEKGETGKVNLSTGSKDVDNKGRAMLNIKTEHKPIEKVSQRSNTELKQHLKRLLKERLKEVLEEVEVESREQKSPSSRNSQFMVPMQSTVVEAQVPAPSNAFASYFTPINQNGGAGGLIGTIKRLFSFGGTDYSGNVGSGSSNFGINSSTHPFSWYSVGRIGTPAAETPAPVEKMKTMNKSKSETKATQQLQKWLDVVLKSSEKPPSLLYQQPLELGSKSVAQNTRQSKYLNYGNPMSSSSSSSIVRLIPPTKMTPVSSLQKPENLLKLLGEPTGTVSSNLLTNTWKPVVSAFKTVFNYSSGKSPTVLKQKTM